MQNLFPPFLAGLHFSQSFPCSSLDNFTRKAMILDNSPNWLRPVSENFGSIVLSRSSSGNTPPHIDDLQCICPLLPEDLGRGILPARHQSLQNWRIFLQLSRFPPNLQLSSRPSLRCSKLRLGLGWFCPCFRGP